MLNQSTINKVILLGKVVKEPELHTEPGEKTLCFTIATTEKVRKNTDYVEHNEYHHIRININLVDGAELRAGHQVYIQGKIQTKQFIDDKQIRRYKTEILASSIEVIDTHQAEPRLSQAHRF